MKVAVAPTGMVDGLSYEDSAGNRTEFRFEGWQIREGPASAPTSGSPGPKGTRIVEN